MKYKTFLPNKAHMQLHDMIMGLFPLLFKIEYVEYSGFYQSLEQRMSTSKPYNFIETEILRFNGRNTQTEHTFYVNYINHKENGRDIQKCWCEVDGNTQTESAIGFRYTPAYCAEIGVPVNQIQECSLELAQQQILTQIFPEVAAKYDFKYSPKGESSR